MAEIPFHATRMGQRYYEVTLPRIVEQLERIAAALERLANENETPDSPEPGG